MTQHARPGRQSIDQGGSGAVGSAHLGVIGKGGGALWVWEQGDGRGGGPIRLGSRDTNLPPQSTLAHSTSLIQEPWVSFSSEAASLASASSNASTARAALITVTFAALAARSGRVRLGTTASEEKGRHRSGPCRDGGAVAKAVQQQPGRDKSLAAFDVGGLGGLDLLHRKVPRFPIRSLVRRTRLDDVGPHRRAVDPSSS